MKISVIVPVYNEEDSIDLLIDKINLVEKEMESNTIEIILVDDGSTDKTKSIIIKRSNISSNIILISLVRNYGQTAALTAGIDRADGEIIVTMDADLQNDPSDIPILIEKLDEGYDVVNGWRKDRNDNYFSRILPSKFANWIISKISGVKLHDYGCTLKVYRKEILEDVKLYGEMHRFIPIYITWQGGKVVEVPVKHHSRIYGESKYGITRTVSVIVDLIFLKFMDKQFVHPIHLFGGFAVFNILLSFSCFFLMIYFKYWNGDSFIQTPLPQLVVLFVITGFLSLFMGFIAEVLMRTYFESQNKASYKIRKD
jgi:glycosyltransferase involved in cell wall biosynthesis